MTPQDEGFIPEDGGERDFEVDTGDQTVSIALVEAEDIDVDNGVVSFEELDEDNGDFTVELYDGDEVEIVGVTTDGAIVTDTGTQVDGISGGEIEFTLEGQDDGSVSVVPVVFVADDEDELATDEDGLPLDDFGIGGVTNVVDIDELDLSPAEADRLLGTEHTVTATLQDVADNVFPIFEGDEVDVEVIRYDTAAERDSDVTAGLGFGDFTTAEIEFSTTIEFDEDGEAVLTYEGPDPDDGEQFDLILMNWEATGAYEGQDQEGQAEVDWIEDEPAVTNVDLDVANGEVLEIDGDIDHVFNWVGGSETVTATVTDQFDRPLEGVEVTFTNGNGLNVERETNAAGEASVTYSGPSSVSRLDEFDAVAEADDVDGIEDSTETGSLDIYWLAAASECDVNNAELLGANFGDQLIYVAGDCDGQDFVSFDYSDAEVDVYELDGTPVTQSDWIEALEDSVEEISEGGTPDLEELSTSNYQDDGLTVFDLHED